MRIATTFAEVDRVCDYIPIVSTVSNIVDLFQKCVYKCLPENISKNRYWTHIQGKELSRCLILLVPILGNIYIAISDHSAYQKDKVSCDGLVQMGQNSERLLTHTIASTAAIAASQISGQQVTAEQMMAASTEDQQPLWMACLTSDAQTVRDLLAKGISPNFYHSGSIPLVIACQHSTVEVVRLLVEGGAEVNTSDRWGISPFAAACTKGDLEMVQFLRPLITDIDAAGPQGATALMFAAAGGHRKIVEFLLKERADPYKKDAFNNGDAATNAMFLNDHAHLLPLLFSEDEDVDARRYFIQIGLFGLVRIQDLTPLLYATLIGAVNSALYLVERSNVQQLDSANSNALYYASKHMPLLQALLNRCHTAEFVNQQNMIGSTALHHAIQLDHPDAALLLLQNGADPFLPDNKGKIPLLLACEKDFIHVVEYIQQQYADRITVQISEQVAVATQAAIARRNQAPQAQPEERKNGLSAAFGLMETAFKCLKSNAKSTADRRARDAQEVEDLGPIPRSGMEMIFGKLPWPV